MKLNADERETGTDKKGGTVKRIDFETHFVTQEWVDALYANPDYPRFVDDKVTGRRRMYYRDDAFEPHGDFLLDRLLDLGQGRIKGMDAAGVDVAVVSLTSPGTDHFDPATGTRLTKRVNDELAAAVDKYPTRLMGFAALAPKDPEAAARELERTVKDLGFKGWKTHSNFGDSYIDEKRYWPILAKAEELDVPIYLHPVAPMIPQLRTYGLALAGAAFGFGIETATAMVRLVLSGAFDAFPKLQIILGHYGEGLPFLMQRIDHPFVRPHLKAADPDVVPDLKRVPSDYLRDNMVVTTSGNYLPAAFNCTREALGMDKILLGTDYPYEEMGDCMRFLEGLGMSEDEKTQLYQGNATRMGFA
jgi:predicted TIM-barrel fold metal-dependent hydrolase